MIYRPLFVSVGRIKSIHVTPTEVCHGCIINEAEIFFKSLLFHATNVVVQYFSALRYLE